MTRGADKYEFRAPVTMKEARQRIHEMTVKVMNVEKQLGDRQREHTMKDYALWRERTKACKIFFVMELRDLKEWVFERRRSLDAEVLGIFDKDDPRALLQRVVLEGRRARKGEANKLEEVLALADLFLVHDA